MATTAMFRSLRTVRSSSSSSPLSTRLFSSSSPIPRPPLPRGPSQPTRPAFSLPPLLQLFSPGPTRLNLTRSLANRSGDAFSPLNSGSKPTDRPPADTEPLFPGCDYKHWLVIMEKPSEIEGVTKQKCIDLYVETLAKVLGSEEEAKKKIYNISVGQFYGFGCEIDEEITNKLEEMPGVIFVLPDSYVDAENKDYGGELYVNGEIVQRSPERQKRVEPVPQRANDRPRNHDKARPVRRREITR